jgi:hypothetical protein
MYEQLKLLSFGGLMSKNTAATFSGPVVRQDRVDMDPERVKLRLSDLQSGDVLNVAPFGIALQTLEKLGEEHFDVSLEVDHYQVHSLNLRKVREVQDSHGRWITAFSVFGTPIDVDCILSMKSLNDILRTRTESHILEASLKPEFRLKVLELKDVLLKLQSDVSKIERGSFDFDKAMLENYEDKVTVRVSDFLSKNLSQMYQSLERLLKDVNPAEMNAHVAFFRENLGEIIFLSSYAHRAFNKPRGYAGDYEMMNHVYSRELRGATLFAKCMQRYFVDEPAGRAVRNREEYVRGKIRTVLNEKNGTAKILSVASGPAKEIQNFVREYKGDFSKIEFHLLDQDLDALKHAQRKIQEAAFDSHKTVKLVLHHKSIKTVISSGLPEKGFDLIYSAGLFDYFTEPVAVFAAKQLFQGLNPAGSLIIGNFSLNNPNQFAMGLIMDWDLIYRSRDQLETMFAGIGKSIVIEEEEQSINLFAVIKG